MTGLQHYDSEIHALDQRIGRLALVCGVNLSDRMVVVAIIKGDFSHCSHRDKVAQEHREELRALLMMKYRIEAGCIHAMGAKECSRLVAEQDERLRRAGFPPHTIAD